MIQDVYLGILIVSFGSLVGSYGMVLFKKASGEISNIFKLIINYKFILGAFLNFIGVLIFVYALRFGDLSTLYPMAGLNYVWVALFSKFHLKEKVNGYKWAGISMILLAVIFIGLGA